MIGQSADNQQGALAGSLTEQKGASNENISVRVLSPGNNGSVSQSNVASSNAAAGNPNGTEQSAGQTQAGRSCGCGGSGTQVIGQSAQNAQAAAAFSATIQEKPSNSNIPVRVLSPGDDGSVSQSNVASSNATAANVNGTTQAASQTQAGGSGIQAIGQESTNGQLALSAALTAQLGASNENAPVRVLSPGNGGSVSQSNNASSNAVAGNANWTGQSAAQSQGSGKDSCCGTGIQAIGQSSENWQGAGALGITLQLGTEAAVQVPAGLADRQQQHADPRPEPWQRRLRPPVEQRLVATPRRELERDEAGREPGPDSSRLRVRARHGHPGDRAAGPERPERGRASQRPSSWGVERVGAGPEVEPW